MGVMCSTHIRSQKCVPEYWSENPSGKLPVEKLGFYGRTKLNGSRRNGVWRHGGMIHQANGAVQWENY
jgi:hypothetical protein